MARPEDDSVFGVKVDASSNHTIRILNNASTIFRRWICAPSTRVGKVLIHDRGRIERKHEAVIVEFAMETLLWAPAHANAGCPTNA